MPFKAPLTPLAAQSSRWPELIPISKVHEYIGMSRSAWYGRYRAEWQIERYTDQTGRYVSKAVVKKFQDRWVGPNDVRDDTQLNQDNAVERVYVRQQMEESIRRHLEPVMKSILEDVVEDAMRAINKQIPFRQFEKILNDLGATKKQAEPSLKSQPLFDHPNQTYLQDQLKTQKPYNPYDPNDLLLGPGEWPDDDDDDDDLPDFQLEELA